MRSKKAGNLKIHTWQNILQEWKWNKDTSTQIKTKIVCHQQKEVLKDVFQAEEG